MKKTLRLVVSLTVALSVVTILVFALSELSAGLVHAGARGADLAVLQMQAVGAEEVVALTLLHTNDLHGHLEPDMYGRGGSAHMATAINEIRATEGEDNVVLMDAGDVYLGAPPISQLLLGESTIDIYNMLGYDVAAYGNHEFDKGQTVLISRTLQSNFPWVGANIVVSGTEWTTPEWALPYVTMTVGVPGSQVTLGVIGLDTTSTPGATVKGMTDGLVFKDMAETCSTTMMRSLPSPMHSWSWRTRDSIPTMADSTRASWMWPKS